MSWVALAWTSVFLFTIFNLLQRVIAVDTKNARTASFVFNLTAGVISIFIFMVSGKLGNITLPSQKEAWIYLLIALFFYGMSERLRFTAAKLLDASVFSTITNISIPIAFIGSIFLYQETITLYKILGTIIILAALTLVSFEKNKQLSARGVAITIVYSVCLALAWMLDKKGALYFSPVIYSVFVWVFPLIVIFLPYIKPGDIWKEYKLSSWKTILLSTVCVAGYLMQLNAVTQTEASRVIPIVQTSTLTTIIAGTIILKERRNIAKKIIAGILAVAGVFY